MLRQSVVLVALCVGTTSASAFETKAPLKVTPLLTTTKTWEGAPIVYRNSGPLITRWDPVYRILRRNKNSSRSPKPAIVWRRVHSSSRNRCWEAYITSIRSRPHRPNRVFAHHSARNQRRFQVRIEGRKPSRLQPAALAGAVGTGGERVPGRSVRLLEAAAG